MGGPIKRDKVWFFAVTRTLGEYTDIAGRFGNLNAGNPTAWNYVVDPSIKSRTAGSRKVVGARVTAQLSERNKISGYYDHQFVCNGSSYAKDADQCRVRGDDWVAVYGFGTWSPESTQSQKGAEHIMQFSYTAPVTNKLLLEAAASQFLSNWNPTSPAGALNYEPFIPVQERSLAGGVPVPNMVYHGYAGLNNNHQTHNVWRASLAYVTGAHSMKVGYAGAYEVTDIFGDFATHGLQYRFNAGVPDLITQRITKWQQANRTRYDAFYLQDQWTRNRLTLQGALRYEHAWSFFPEGLNGLLTDSVFGGPPRTLPRADGVTGYHDIAPRMGMAYDVFGNGKTGIKVNLSKYWQYAANDGVYIGTNPASTFAQTANRSWTDANGNFTPNCDLQNPLAQDNRASGGDFCGALDNQNFFTFRQTGSALGTATQIDPAPARWLERPSLRLAVQRVGTAAAAAARLCRDRLQPPLVGKLHRHRQPCHRPPGFRHLYVHRALRPASFLEWTAGVLHPEEQPNRVRRGRQLPDARQQLRRRVGVLAGPGIEHERADDQQSHACRAASPTGAGTRDFCEVAAALPELYSTVGSILMNAATSPIAQASACRVEEPWLWAWRGLVSYTVPKIDVQVSAIMKSQPNVTATNDPASNGLAQTANFFQTNAAVLAALGRPIAGGASTATLDLAQAG